jgi:hypothetical protein
MKNQLPDELNDLFLFVPPDELRRTIHQIHYTYLINAQTLPPDHKKQQKIFIFLFNFLKKQQH